MANAENEKQGQARGAALSVSYYSKKKSVAFITVVGSAPDAVDELLVVTAKSALSHSAMLSLER